MANTREFTPEEYLKWLKNGNINQRAVAIAFENVTTDGDHHRLWMIDQMVRILSGSGYEEFCRMFRYMFGEEWLTGIAP